MAVKFLTLLGTQATEKMNGILLSSDDTKLDFGMGDHVITIDDPEGDNAGQELMVSTVINGGSKLVSKIGLFDKNNHKVDKDKNKNVSVSCYLNWEDAATTTNHPEIAEGDMTDPPFNREEDIAWRLNTAKFSTGKIVVTLAGKMIDETVTVNFLQPGGGMMGGFGITAFSTNVTINPLKKRAIKGNGHYELTIPFKVENKERRHPFVTSVAFNENSTGLLIGGKGFPFLNLVTMLLQLPILILNQALRCLLWYH